MMQLVHELPGTTFSSTAERGAYDSDGQAALTLRELQGWMTLAVVPAEFLPSARELGRVDLL